jgi:hypothetical protein
MQYQQQSLAVTQMIGETQYLLHSQEHRDPTDHSEPKRDMVQK